MGEVNSDQCYVCFICGLAANKMKQDFIPASRPLCKKHNIIRDDALIRHLRDKEIKRMSSITAFKNARALKKKTQIKSKLTPN